MNLDEDRRNCADYGSGFGTAEHSRCMLSQQERRDVQALDAQELGRISAETARTNVETLARIRCERAAVQDRNAGVRPRRCD